MIELTKKQRWLIVIAFVLAAAVAYRWFGPAIGKWPTAERADGVRQDIKSLTRDLRSLERERARKQAVLESLRQAAEGFWNAPRNAPAQLQAMLENKARLAKVTLQRTGTPRRVVVSEHIFGVEMSLQAHGSMRDMKRLLTEIEYEKPQLFWNSCSIRPDNPTRPQGVILSGEVMVLCLVEDIREQLQGDDIQ